MGQFFKFMFASMLGFILGSVIIGLIFGIMIVGGIAAASSQFSFEGKPTRVKDNSVLYMDLGQPIVDRGRKDNFNLDFGPFRNAGALGLNDILADLEKAKTDDRVKGIFMDIGFNVDARMATMKEIRDKIIEFKKESGKPVIAYGEMFTQGTYYLASAADQVYLVPEGDLDFRGLRTEMMFFKGMFDKLGIDIQFIRGSNNQFKSYGESFIYDHMSDANRKQMTELITGLWDQYLTAIGDSRKLDKAKLNQVAENMLIRHAPDAVTQGFVDGVKYRDEVLAIVKEKMGLPADKDINTTSLANYTRSYVSRSAGGKSDDKRGRSSSKAKVAVVYAQGDIMSGESEDGSIGSTTLAAAIREAREDSTVKAIVLRVNSPGGSGLASDVIWREVALAKKSKPVVVSMGDLAASGGYYISCAADRIYAQPNTITGSIGVFGIIPNMQGFFNDKLGITFDGVQTNKYAGMMTTSRPLTAEEKSIIQGYVDRFYDTFKSRVAEGRDLTVAQVDSIGQGRVWTGTAAKSIGLVDEIGGLEVAIKGAAELAHLEEGDYRTRDYPEQEDLLKELMKSLNGGAKAWVREEAFGADVELVQQFEAVRKARGMMGVQARMPYDLRVY
jgi:protease-4